MRPEKADIVGDLSEKLNSSSFMLVTDYQKMKVPQFGELRNRLSPLGGEIHVVKNSFLKRAMATRGLPDAGEQPTGHTAAAPARGEGAVVKNRFRKRAMAPSGLPDVGDQLTGQTAVVTGQADVAPVAKILKSFAAEFKIAALKVGVVGKAGLSR